MTDVETILRAGLAAYERETARTVWPPPMQRLHVAAAPRRRAPWRIVPLFVGALAISTGAAAALGVLPGPVESVLHELRSWGFGANRGATRVASTTVGDTRYEVWFAPLDDGGFCAYERVIQPAGDVEHGGSSQCSHEPMAPRTATEFGALDYPELVAPGAVASGQLPLGAAAAVFTFDDGSTLRVPAQTDGWFITAFPSVQAGVRLVSVTAVDDDDRVVARS